MVMPRRPLNRYGRSVTGLLIFLVASMLVLGIVIYQFLFPAMRAAVGIDATGRQQMAALALLVLSIVLAALVAILILALKPGRFFLPRKSEKRTRTVYPDAWAESGRRMETPPDEE